MRAETKKPAGNQYSFCEPKKTTTGNQNTNWEPKKTTGNQNTNWEPNWFIETIFVPKTQNQLQEPKWFH
jgi:hypothetical protein